MPFSDYQLHPGINPEKAFILVYSKEVISYEKFDLVKDVKPEWLTALVELCHLDLSSIERHMTYFRNIGGTEEKEFNKSLAYVYYVLNKFVDEHIIDKNQHKSIEERIKEGFSMCSEGVQQRIAYIITTLARPTSFLEYLQVVRQDLVETAAKEYAKDVHIFYRCYKMACQDGLGVPVVQVNDPYLDDNDYLYTLEEIKNGLKRQFEINFSPVILKYLLSDRLKGWLPGYQGKKSKEHAYKYGFYSKFFDFIRIISPSMLCSNEIYTKFLILEENEVVDINWHAVQDLFQERLIEEGCIKKESAKTFLELVYELYAKYELKIKDDNIKAIDDIVRELDNDIRALNGLKDIEFIRQLIEIKKKFPDIYRGILPKITRPFDDVVTGDIFDELVNHNNCCLQFLLDYIKIKAKKEDSDQLFGALLCCEGSFLDSQFYNVFLKTISLPKKFNMLLEFVKDFPMLEISIVLESFLETGLKKRDLFYWAAKRSEESFSYLLEFLKDVYNSKDKDIKELVLKFIINKGNSDLLIELVQNNTCFFLYCNFLSSIADSSLEGILKEIIFQKDHNKNNVLLLLLKNEKLKGYFIDFWSFLIKIYNIKIISTLLTSENNANESAVTVLGSLLLYVISQMPALLSDAIFIKQFVRTDSPWSLDIGSFCCIKTQTLQFSEDEERKIYAILVYILKSVDNQDVFQDIIKNNFHIILLQFDENDFKQNSSKLEQVILGLITIYKINHDDKQEVNWYHKFFNSVYDKEKRAYEQKLAKHVQKFGASFSKK